MADAEPGMTSATAADVFAAADEAEPEPFFAVFAGAASWLKGQSAPLLHVPFGKNMQGTVGFAFAPPSPCFAGGPLALDFSFPPLPLPLPFPFLYPCHRPCLLALGARAEVEVKSSSWEARLQLQLLLAAAAAVALAFSLAGLVSVLKEISWHSGVPK